MQAAMMSVSELGRQKSLTLGISNSQIAERTGGGTGAWLRSLWDDLVWG